MTSPIASFTLTIANAPCTLNVYPNGVETVITYGDNYLKKSWCPKWFISDLSTDSHFESLYINANGMRGPAYQQAYSAIVNMLSAA